jgi:ubiquinone/menaquinone biosynthesis C-methylase UbiE
MNAQQPAIFNDAEAYERFMGCWSRAVGEMFIQWLAPPKDAIWLDVGCGTGIFTRLIEDTCAPRTICGIDPSSTQIGYARKHSAASFQIANAADLPFSDATFDVIASALVLNFIPKPLRALLEMRRVARPGGRIAAYVWNFAAERSTSWPLSRALRRIGVGAPRTPGSDQSSIKSLDLLFNQARFERIITQSFEIAIRYSTFDEYWHCQVPPFSAQGKAIDALNERDHIRLVEAVRLELPTAPDGSISYSAQANAISGTVPA